MTNQCIICKSTGNCDCDLSINELIRLAAVKMRWYGLIDGTVDDEELYDIKLSVSTLVMDGIKLDYLQLTQDYERWGTKGFMERRLYTCMKAQSGRLLVPYAHMNMGYTYKKDVNLIYPDYLITHDPINHIKDVEHFKENKKDSGLADFILSSIEYTSKEIRMGLDRFTGDNPSPVQGNNNDH